MQIKNWLVWWDIMEFSIHYPRIEHRPIPRTVIWGGHPDRDIWIGSDEDRWREAKRKAQSRVVFVFQNDFGEAMKEFNQRLIQFGKVYAEASRKLGDKTK